LTIVGRRLDSELFIGSEGKLMRKHLLLFLFSSVVLAAVLCQLPRVLTSLAGEPVEIEVEDGKKDPDPKPAPTVAGAREEARERIRRAKARAKIRRMILEEYVEKVDEKKLFYGALRGMVNELDPHSQFLTPAEFKDITASTMGEFGGLGIEITIRGGWITVVTPLMGTPAFKAGMLPGDRIIKIDGKSADGMKLDKAVGLMRGKPGTKVTVSVAREGAVKLKDITIIRQIIKIDSVRIPQMVDQADKIGYVSLSSFQADTSEELSGALNDLEKKGMRALIIDLRSNGGGRLDAAVKVADQFISKGLIVSMRGRKSSLSNNSPFRAQARGTRPNYPIAVLVNRGSASASEIVAGALRDHKRAVLVGEKTFGKASVQTLRRIMIGKEMAGLKLTTAHYYTPGGHLIHKKGIEPDIKVEMTMAMLGKVFKQQHDRWVKQNDPKLLGDPLPAKKKLPVKKSEGDDDASEVPALKDDPDPSTKDDAEKIVDTQLQAGLQALRAILVDRGARAARAALNPIAR
jgi:carboxyl-terminal processing protease